MSPPDPPPVDVMAPADPTSPPGPPPFWAPTPLLPDPLLPDPLLPDPLLAAPLLPARPRWRRLRRWCAVVAVVGVLLLAASAVVGVQAYRDSRTPQAAVRAYFVALSSGDAAAALAAGTVPTGGRALVSDAVLAATLATAPIDDVTTGPAEVRGDQASVAVRYRLGGPSPQEVTDTVALRRADGRWRLQRSAVPVVVAVGDAPSWAAIASSPPFRVPTDVQLVFPGAVPVFYRSPLLAVADAARVVRFDGTRDVLGVTAQVTTAGRETATRTVVAQLTACAKGGAGVDPFCPQPPPGRAGGAVLRAVPQSFRGDLSGLDRIDLSVVVDTSAAGTLTVNGSVEVEGNWQVLDYDNVAQDRSGTATVIFRGTIALGRPDTLTWERT